MVREEEGRNGRWLGTRRGQMGGGWEEEGRNGWWLGKRRGKMGGG